MKTALSGRFPCLDAPPVAWPPMLVLERSVIKMMLFNPFEIGFCGYSGAGKTTLICRLIEHFSHLNIGYIKHDAHGFQMDREGKDTWKATRSGAVRVFIADSRKEAMLHDRLSGKFDRRHDFLDCDAVFVEGYRQADLDKILVLDRDNTILERVNSGELQRITAIVGAELEPPPGLPESLPYFQRDDIAAIAGFLAHRRQPPPVYGLVLTGGRSTRMGQDKALLSDGAKSRVEAAFELLGGYCRQVFVSARRDQQRPAHMSRIDDQFIDMGPMGGILSAQRSHRQAAWLVLACDLPRLDTGTLEYLLAERDCRKMATCYLSSSDGLPEPLCAVYEPKSHGRLLQFLGQGIQCPRKVLLNSPVKTLSLVNPRSLDNVNHAHEWQQFVSEKVF